MWTLHDGILYDRGFAYIVVMTPETPIDVNIVW